MCPRFDEEDEPPCWCQKAPGRYATSLNEEGTKIINTGLHLQVPPIGVRDMYVERAEKEEVREKVEAELTRFTAWMKWEVMMMDGQTNKSEYVHMRKTTAWIIKIINSSLMIGSDIASPFFTSAFARSNRGPHLDQCCCLTRLVAMLGS